MAVDQSAVTNGTIQHLQFRSIRDPRGFFRHGVGSRKNVQWAVQRTWANGRASVASTRTPTAGDTPILPRRSVNASISGITETGIGSIILKEWAVWKTLRESACDIMGCERAATAPFDRVATIVALSLVLDVGQAFSRSFTHICPAAGFIPAGTAFRHRSDAPADLDPSVTTYLCLIVLVLVLVTRARHSCLAVLSSSHPPCRTTRGMMQVLEPRAASTSTSTSTSTNKHR